MSSTLYNKFICLLICLGISALLQAQKSVSDSLKHQWKSKLSTEQYLPDSTKRVGWISHNTPAILKKGTITSDSHVSIWQHIPKPTYHGRLGVEGYYTTFQNPRVLNEPQYLRLSGNASVSWFGMPLLVDFYRTSESQTFYNSNYFKVRFDHETYINGIKQGWQKRLQESTSQLNANQIKKQQGAKAQVAMDKQKEQLLAQQDKFKKDLNEKTQNYKNTHAQKADSLFGNYQDSLQSRISSQRDSSENRLRNQEQKSRDSANLARLQQDTQRIARRIREVENAYRQYLETKQHYDSLITVDSAKLVYYQKLLEDPKGNAGAWLKEKGFPKQLVALSYLKDFQIGVVTPFINNYSVTGIGMKGITTGVAVGRSEWSLVGGKAIISDLNYYNRNNAKYERLFLAASYKFHFNKNSELLLFGHHAQDPEKKFTAESRTAFRNSNYGFQILANPKNLVHIDAAAAISHYQSLNTAIQNVSYPGNSSLSELDNKKARSAYTIRLEKNLTKWLSLEASDQFVGPGFKNLGNPFMRTNFREQQVKSKFGVFKSQVNFTAFYKSLRDNPLSLSEITNRTSGYGLSMQTRFANKKLPNFNASVSPYEQGNNHPDSLFRVNSRYSIVTAGMTYRINRSRFKYYLLVYGSQSRMQFNDTFGVKVQSLSVSQDVAIGKHLTLGIGTTLVRTYPGVDSSQVNVWQTRIGYMGKRGSNAMLSSQYSQYLNGAFRKGVSVSVSLPVSKTYKLTAKTAYDHYYKLWGMQNQKAWSGLVRLEIRL